ncbi:TraR/DksA family transcriptional regulator [Ruixingdingia sedimenti]|uniref:TraR/DksA family transcriptional regulator n=1 Tax=Ruixingdingia sedimenti TaxID=3073604 RepID=A0ABU1F5E0_9RHOB|nr:TraR/DksA family transcriptional regulator [Xinfangfangia sp. LG-4]MDR5652092.1 TraR/DksA family transcriptional regulator [Xinfangfangia sp. LG-4]
MTTIAARKAQLEARLDDLRGRLRSIEAELQGHDTADWEDRATESEEDEVLEGMGVSGAQEIRKILAALERIEAGEYGYCTKCGAEIAPERLDVLPFTPFCRNCAV